MKWVYNDGGRSKYFRGITGDCVTRSVAIVTGLPYIDVYNALAHGMKIGGFVRGRKQLTPRDGVPKSVFKKYIDSLGLKWTPTMSIGSGCRVHLRNGELPMGRLIVQTSHHLTAVIDGVIHDIYDPSRDGSRCVYGYWQ